MAPAALPYVYCTEADVQSLLSVDGETGRVDDNANAVIDSGAEAGYVVSAINWATAKVNLYALKLYAAADLAQDWTVNNWAVILAAYWLSLRRGNPAPSGIGDLYKEVMADLDLVRRGVVQLDVATRAAGWPAWSNVRVDISSPLRRIRVERPISDTGGKGAARQPAAAADRAAEYIIEWR